MITKEIQPGFFIWIWLAETTDQGIAGKTELGRRYFM
jgi:hypothetical protein